MTNTAENGIGKLAEQSVAGDSASSFSEAYPGHQAAIDLFQWTTAMPAESGLIAGGNDYFTDVRLTLAAQHIGGFSGKTILELGPYEVYNTAQFERFGAASVLAIEVSRVNFLKCLVVKNVLGLRSTFLHGDMLRYLDDTDSRFDLCWASGLLYHVTDPIRLLEGIARVSKAAFIWTQYTDESRAKDPMVSNFMDPSCNKTHDYRGKSITLHHRNYNEKNSQFFGGGSQSFSYWMSKDDIFHCLQALGFRRTVMLVDNPNHPPGAAMFFLAFAN